MIWEKDIIVQKRDCYQHEIDEAGMDIKLL